MKMTVELFDSIINTSQDCVFWKDKDRRFLGVNQAFLDFYGFDSADILIGKNDEDMGWHSDPEPYRQDELRVLAGESTYKVQGKCFIRGEERDIIASKRPLYEGDEIVGLVGSFVDITDVIRRQNKMDGSQVMYDMEKLRAFPYFDGILDEISLDEILDPLTGVISRGYAVEFVNSLISSGSPFSFTIMDLDNFKYINDTYGHQAGDRVLSEVSKGLAEYTDGYGIVGRFGGDELLIVNLRDVTYDEREAFFEGLYGSDKVLRRKIDYEGCHPFVTGTAGCASFPEDADSFETLFECIDKALYRGKRKGRNCYVIYLEEKYGDLKIQKLTGGGIYSAMQALSERFEEGSDITEKLRNSVPVLADMLQISDLYYAGVDGRLHGVINPDTEGDVSDIGNMIKGDMYADNMLDDISKKSPLLAETMEACGFGSILIARVGTGDRTFGYLICAVQRSLRIWQENEQALLFFLAKLLSSYMKEKGVDTIS